MLNESQKIAVRHTDGPLLILAGAGAGKTHTLTERVARMVGEGIPPSSILCVTFTNKAAKEMRERIAMKLGFESVPSVNPFRRSDLPLVGTFHSVAVYFLRSFIDRLGYGKDFIIFDEDDKIRTVKGILTDRKIDDKELPARQAAYMISAAKNEGIGPETFRKNADSYIKSLVADIYAEYEKRTKAMNALDFDDILLKLLALLSDEEVLWYLQNRFAYFFIDEYQDTNDIQYRIIKLLSAKTRNLAVVGDDWQGIYSWRGANIKNILSFERDYPDATIVKLEQNYRSTKTVINAANAVVKNNREALDKTLWTDNEEGEKIQVVESYDEKEEASQIAERISENGNFSDWAILYRTNGQSRLIEEALIRRNIPYRVFGWVKFYERKEIKDILSYLRFVYNASDFLAFSRIVNVPSRKIGEKSVEAFRIFMDSFGLDAGSALERIQEAQEIPTAAKTPFLTFSALYREFRELSQKVGVKDVMSEIVKHTKYEDFLRSEYSKEEVEGKLENVKEFLNMASRYDGLAPRESLALFLEDIALITDQDRSEASGGVSLMTIHLAKGLEFSHVVIAGAEEWLFPHSRSLMETKALEEERRLMYVAMTRAKKQLVITRARERYTFGSYSANPASRFLKEIPENLVEKVEAKPKYSFSSNFASSVGSKYSWLDGGSAYDQTRESSVSQEITPPIKSHTVRHDVSDFHLGCRVRHAQFGDGVIVSLKDDIGEIAFNGANRGIRKMNLRIAPVEKV